MRTFATITVAGIAGLVLLKLLGVVVLPLLALFLGVIALTVKLAVVAAVGYFVYSLFKRARKDPVVG
ncbi:MAG: hypothetical protein ACE5GJ_14180 [Gemmatimonadota bacterium]